MTNHYGHGSDRDDQTRQFNSVSPEDETKAMNASGYDADADFAQPSSASQQYPPRGNHQYVPPQQPHQQYSSEHGRYVTHEEMLSAENQKLTEQLSEKDHELSTLRDETDTKVKSLWIAVAVLTIVALIAIAFSFMSGSDDPDDGPVEDVTQSREYRELEAERNAERDRANAAEQSLDSRSQESDDQSVRADNAERELRERENEIQDKNTQIEQLQNQLDDAQQDAGVTETVTETITTTVSPDGEQPTGLRSLIPGRE